MLKRLFIGYYNKSVILTYIGVMTAILAIIFSIKLMHEYAALLILVSGLCDLFDGAIARSTKRTQDEKEFGIQIDSLADVISFCITPVVFLYSLGFDNYYHIVAYILLVVFGITRLANFNVNTSAEASTKYYVGMPVTSMALIIPFIYISLRYVSFDNALYVLILLVISSFGFIYNFKIPKPKNISLIILLTIAIIEAILIVK